MKSTPASTLFPTTTPDAADTRTAIEHLENEAQTHGDRRDNNENEKPVVPSVSATREETGGGRLRLSGVTWGQVLLLCAESAPRNER